MRFQMHFSLQENEWKLQGTGSVSTAIIKPSDNELLPQRGKRPAKGNVFYQVLLL